MAFELIRISNDDLTPEMVPSNLEDIERIARFAMTLDDKCFPFPMSDKEKLRSLLSRTTFDDLTEARYFLYVLQRGAKWRTEYFPDDSVRTRYHYAHHVLLRCVGAAAQYGDVNT